MLKLATIATALLLSVEANAAKVGRNRKVNIYSSKSEFGRETVDPYLGFPDEREQRSLQEGSVALEMSMPAAIGSMAGLSIPAGEGGFGANAVVAAAESADSSSAMTMGHSAAVATIVSAIAGVAALV